MSEPYCAVCGRRVPLDEDHVEIEAEWVHTDDRNDLQSYLMHTPCALRVLDGWEKPA